MFKKHCSSFRILSIQLMKTKFIWQSFIKKQKNILSQLSKIYIFKTLITFHKSPISKALQLTQGQTNWQFGNSVIDSRRLRQSFT